MALETRTWDAVGAAGKYLLMLTTDGKFAGRAVTAELTV